MACSESPLPLVDLSNLGLEYQGAFRIKNGTRGDSRIAYTSGDFAVTPGAQSFYITGHENLPRAVAEFKVPALGASAGAGAAIGDVPAITSLPMTDINVNDPATGQPFAELKSRAPRVSEGEKLDRITGLEYTADGKLIVNWLEYYDADAPNRDTTLVVHNPTSLVDSPVTGFHQLQGAAHLSGWASTVPSEWQGKLGTEYLFGYASNYAIVGRLSIGPSAFAVDVDQLIANEDYATEIPTTPLLDYPVIHPLHTDEYNDNDHDPNNPVGDNDLWTEISQARYGFIIPGTRTYMVVGHSGGHESAIDYKITQSNGHLCGGPCAIDFRDEYNYVWFYDVEDMVAVKNGEMQPYELRPYSYGELELPYQPAPNDPRFGYFAIGGADYDPETRQLFLLLQSADGEQGPYERAPLMLVYQLPETFTQVVPEPASLLPAAGAVGVVPAVVRRRKRG